MEDQSPKRIMIQREYSGNRLPDDMMMNIFQRLPVKYILRSRAVCKPWNVLICKEKKLLPPSMIGFFYKPKGDRRCKLRYNSTQNNYNNDRAIDTDLSFLPRNRLRSIASYCNGLILCNEDLKSHNGLLICNPATKKWATLPYDPRTMMYGSLVLAFDPSISRHYNVIVLSSFYSFIDGAEYVFFKGIFSSETCKWSATDDDLNKLSLTNAPFLNETVYINGAIHLLDLSRSIIVATDLKGKILNRFRVPLIGNYMKWGILHISKVADKLQYAVVSDPIIHVWILDDYNRGHWVLKHNIETSIGIGAYIAPGIHIGTYVSAFKAFHPDLDVVFLELPEKKKLVAYHLTTRKETELLPLPSTRKRFEVFPYSPCYLEDIDLMK